MDRRRGESKEAGEMCCVIDRTDNEHGGQQTDHGQDYYMLCCGNLCGFITLMGINIVPVYFTVVIKYIYLSFNAIIPCRFGIIIYINIIYNICLERVTATHVLVSLLICKI